MEEDDNAGVRDSHPRPVIHRDADLSRLAPWHLNDMVVDHDGRAWVGNFGFDLMGVRRPTPPWSSALNPTARVR